MQTQARTSFNAAEKLKAAGWDLLTDCYYKLDNGEFCYHDHLNNFNKTSWAISAPALYHVSEWLIEEKNIKVSIDYDKAQKSWYVKVYDIQYEYKTRTVDISPTYPSYILALEAGILEALKMLND